MMLAPQSQAARPLHHRRMTQTTIPHIMQKSSGLCSAGRKPVSAACRQRPGGADTGRPHQLS
ncbi:hypothetical protein D7X33_05630 [Butyricicoccus sp. 1XD8-22]|nr:hypothetical protein D7X33_05630 [Butyricicoccus sp. 1XD8-22]